MQVRVSELERCASAWEDAADEVEVLLDVLAELDPSVLGEAAGAASGFVAAVVRAVESWAGSARVRGAGLRGWAADVAGTDEAAAARMGGGVSW